MVELQTISNGAIRTILIGLAESEAEKTQVLDNLSEISKRSWMTRCIDHVIEYLRTFLPEEVKITADYPVLLGESGLTNLQLPTVTISVQSGTSTEANLGMLIYADGKKSIIGYNQTAFINIDVWGKTMYQAINIAGIISERMIIEGRKGYLMTRGFQTWRVEYSSRTQVGFEYWRNYLYNPNFLTIPVYRHLLIMRTSFDVVLQEPETSYGIITQIVLGGKDEYTWQDILGISMEYLYAEDIYLNWFNLGV